MVVLVVADLLMEMLVDSLVVAEATLVVLQQEQLQLV
jgi:hypothetical protein